MALSSPFLVMAKPVGPVCNLSCDYCYYLDKRSLFPKREPFRMSDEVLSHYIESTIAASSGPVVPFAFHGGEPTLAGKGFFERVIELQKRHLPKGWSAWNNLQTNGTRLDDALCKLLKKNKFSVGISIDGPEHLHDINRKDRLDRPTHKKVLQGLNQLRTNGIEPDVLCTLNSTNVNHPQEVYHFFLDLKVSWLQFLPVVARDETGTLLPLSVEPRKMGDFLNEVFDEWVRYDLKRIGIQNFLECLLVVDDKPANLCVMAPKCGNVLAMEHDGSIYSCDHFVNNDHYLGNIQRDSLELLLTSDRQVEFGATKSTGLPDQCKSCPVRKLCNGGCPKDRFATSKDGQSGLNYLCEGYLSSYSHILPYISEMVVLKRRSQPIHQIMDQIAQREKEFRTAIKHAQRNDQCPCGSRKKLKSCCINKRIN
ncbi:anaerobic sulfatase maturase [Acidithrix ferrooxidans]|uniref:Anaerobic sulfatase-maturating enzyme n=1 Tax=Acidithrix ferrooxidans TaxID=1280514 RepID=A0A0D8HG52_9ACTN|nr:anaerobic sulfatase maturase [Acidithrix ferrooxidans]KJF16940.1 anaerobic sulfatase-maturating enzyme [Acidithrix ferrooxidans]